jgi:hypothetical protein
MQLEADLDAWRAKYGTNYDFTLLDRLNGTLLRAPGACLSRVLAFV